MVTVKRTIRAVNENIEHARCLVGKSGWSIGKQTKHSIMSVAVVCTYEVSFKDEKEYEQNIGSANEKFEQDLLSAGFSKDYIENNSGKFALPRTNEVSDNDRPMTWKEWHNNRK